MMLIFRRMAFFAIMLALTAGCSGSRGGKDPAIQRDLTRYKAQMSSIIDLESEAIEAHEKATADTSMDDAKYAPFLSGTFLPKYEEFLRELSRIHPVTDEMIAIHKLYLRRTELLIDGFRDIEKSARTGDAELLVIAREKDAEGDRLFAEWQQRMNELAKIYSPSK